jgi:hypothetical protein
MKKSRLLQLVLLQMSLLKFHLHKHFTLFIHGPLLQAGLDVIALICKAYVGLIQDNCGPRAIVPRMPDLNYELRREKCELARMALSGLHTKLGHLAHARERT